MSEESGKFAALFRKYRLKAEFSTLSELGLALAEKGLIYEDSIFSHWQKGTRVPQSRNILIKLIEIFIQRQALSTTTEANAFLSAANQGYLSEEEIQKLSLRIPTTIFQVPNEIANFCGREEIVKNLLHRDLYGSVILLHGPAGVGKTALAIKLGHLLRDQFPDGVLWYKVEEDNIMDILLSIARIFGEDISTIKNVHVRATTVRSLLTGKNTLLFFDSAELCPDISLLLSNSSTCTTILTSQHHVLKSTVPYLSMRVNSFTDDEVLSLFRDVLKERYLPSNKKTVLQTANHVGNLPLALHILVRQLQHTNLSISRLPNLLDQDNSILHTFTYEDKNLHLAIDTSYRRLDTALQSVLVSTSIFQGKDFSAESISRINGFSESAAIRKLQHLADLSLIEHSTKNRFRIHPAIQEFVRDKLDKPRSSYLVLIAVCIFAIFSLWWGFLQIFVEKTHSIYSVFTSTYGFMALYGGVLGIHTSRKWGGTRTFLGKGVLFFSIGLLMQEIGQLLYSYYIYYLKIVIPYPSVGDFFFYGTIPFYIMGVVFLGQASGVQILYTSTKSKLQAILVPAIMLGFSYFFFLRGYTVDWATPIRVFIDLIAPLGEAAYISLAILTYTLTKHIFDGIMKSKVLLILVALFFQYIADWTFVYQVSRGTWIAGGVNDYMYFCAYFLMTLGLLQVKSIVVKIKNE